MKCGKKASGLVKEGEKVLRVCEEHARLYSPLIPGFGGLTLDQECEHEEVLKPRKVEACFEEALVMIMTASSMEKVCAGHLREAVEVLNRRAERYWLHVLSPGAMCEHRVVYE